MSLNDWLNVVPPCLRPDAVVAQQRIDTCLIESLSYWINLLMGIVAIAAFIYLIYGGIQMATAFGNESKYTAAKNTVTYALVGVVIASLSLLIVNFTLEFFNTGGAGTRNVELRDPNSANRVPSDIEVSASSAVGVVRVKSNTPYLYVKHTDQFGVTIGSTTYAAQGDSAQGFSAAIPYPFNYDGEDVLLTDSAGKPVGVGTFSIKVED